MMYKEDDWESYFYEGEDVLINKLNIHDKHLLRKKEYEIVAKKNTLLYLSDPLDKFGVDELLFIHKYLFGDIYPFAGEYRLVNMGRDERASFMDYKNIDISLHEVLDNLDDKLMNNAYSKFLYAEALAHVYKQLLDSIHPFREGNGRTIREFLRQYVQSRNKFIDNVDYELDFSLIKDDKKRLDLAVTSDVLGPLVLLFNEILKVKTKENEQNIFYK